MVVASRQEIPTQGRDSLIVALIGTTLHIRIFDTNGNELIDKPEDELVEHRHDPHGF
jgi:hypothetical protein